MKDEAKKITKNRQKKEVIVAELAEKVSRAKAMIFTNYQGMTHVQLEHLKKGLRTLHAEVVIAKNSLLSLAIEKEKRIEEAAQEKKKSLQGPTGTLFIYEDIVAPIKELAKIMRTLKLPTIKFGIVDGKLLADNEVMRLSTLPTREVLLAQLVGGLKSPIYGLHRALNWNIQKLVMTLQQIKDLKAQSSNVKTTA